ncbi:integrase [Mesorhizobium sp. M1A.F.Ca.ET.072.01.1.1]|nr:integrase [Mesorhizobium sp. M1A.F.Ca.ET.072.01.1.1]TIV04363.1 MAG: integrase [Mesorhizobium sp.]
MAEPVRQIRVRAPGLRWIRRPTHFEPRWIAPEQDRKAGYRPKTINLSRWAGKPDELGKRCDALWADMLEWRSSRLMNPFRFDGTIKSLVTAYSTHPQSSFHQLKAVSHRVYTHYLGQIEKEIGDRAVGEISGLDLKGWHVRWSSNGEKPAASKMCRAVLMAAVAFGVEARLPGCADLAISLKAASRKLPGPRRRETVMTAEQVVALRAAAHADGRPSCALAYAIVFEAAARLWDVLLWLSWEDVDADLVLRYVPSKTSGKTGLAVTYPLTKAPMVMEELAHWPEPRSGPMIVCEGTGMPYSSNYFGEKWRLDRAKAGIADNVWARDLRASGITEGRASGVSTDDAAKVAGHASTRTTSAVYDRATLEAAERFADARVAYRHRKSHS